MLGCNCGLGRLQSRLALMAAVLYKSNIAPAGYGPYIATYGNLKEWLFRQPPQGNLCKCHLCKLGFSALPPAMRPAL
jgi:hypothetical protein